MPSFLARKNFSHWLDDAEPATANTWTPRKKLWSHFQQPFLVRINFSHWLEPAISGLFDAKIIGQRMTLLRWHLNSAYQTPEDLEIGVCSLWSRR